MKWLYCFAMNDLLFIYGTLLGEKNEYAIYLKNNSEIYSDGKLRGRLYDIGEYPGAILSKDHEYVYGVILKIKEPAKVLTLIDQYEGFGENELQPNEFVRVLTRAETKTGFVDCWIYLYNLSTKGLPVINSGRYE